MPIGDRHLNMIMALRRCADNLNAKFYQISHVSLFPFLQKLSIAVLFGLDRILFNLLLLNLSRQIFLGHVSDVFERAHLNENAISTRC